MQNVGSATNAAAHGNSNKRLKIGLAIEMGDAAILQVISGPMSSAASSVAPPQDAIDDAEEAVGVEANIRSLPSGRIWATSFWGFNPEGDGYLGFTREGDREWFLSQ